MIDSEFLISLYFNSEDAFEQEHRKQLSDWIQQSPEHAVRFVHAAFLHRAIHDYVATEFSQEMILFEKNKEDIFDETLWTALAEYEKTAPEIDIPKEEPKKELVQKVVYSPREKRKLSAFNLFTFVTSAAAILFFVLFVNFAPERSYNTEVATIVDQENVKWAQTDVTLKSGSRLWTNDGPLHLQKGIVKLQYDNDVDVLVEGPAAFEINRLGLFLEYGRLYSRVSQSGLGFTVQTPTSQFVDQGTEFGVQADVNGSSELHVIKGKVQFFAGSNGEGRTGQLVTENNAVRFDANHKQIKKIPISKNVFVRQVNSTTGMVWRGQMKIDLADIIGGGNGFGTGKLEIGIHPVTGKIGEIVAEDRLGNGKYASVPESRYIDGVFVPNAQFSPVVVSSKGHKFVDCPVTNNVFYMEIINSKLTDPAVSVLWKEVAMGSGIYGSRTCPGIFMHANLGITFDLDMIRADIRDAAEVTRFIADAGLSPAAERKGNVDVWVLVDGTVRYYQKNITEKGKDYPISINLAKADRFLTLITTDGGDADYPEPSKRATDSDWCLFAEPVLILE